MANNELETVYSTTDPAEAEIVRIGLQNEGIAAFVDGATQAGLTGVLTVGVCVAQQDAARARTLIEELEHVDIPDEEWDEAVGGGNEPSADDSAP